MTFDEIMSSYDAAVAAANKANEARYNKAVAALASAQTRSSELYGQADQLLTGLGTTRNDQINTDTTQAKAATQQSASNRGLGNSTVVDSLLRGLSSDQTKAQTQVSEAVDTQRSGLKTQEAGANTNLAALMANLYGSKYDNAPNAALYSQLAQKASSSPKKTIFLGYSKPWSEL
jgi:hypothetical protein